MGKIETLKKGRRLTGKKKKTPGGKTSRKGKSHMLGKGPAAARGGGDFGLWNYPPKLGDKITKKQKRKKKKKGGEDLPRGAGWMFGV